ncbi:MAG: hypothetical protein WD708_02625, partial [Kiritimatiellia bacterium]
STDTVSSPMAIVCSSIMKLLNSPLFISAGYLVLRMVLSPLSPVPGAVALDPLWLLLPWITLRGGRCWMLALLPGLVIGDVLAGFMWPQIGLRVLGAFVVGSLISSTDGFHRQALLWILTHALWSSLMPDWRGDYPLGYLYAVWVLQGALWWGLLAPGKGFGSLKPLFPLLLIPAGLLVLHLLFPAPPLWPLPRLAAQSSLALRIGATCLLPLPLLLRIWSRPKSRKPTSQTSGPGRWTHLAD